MPTRQQVDQVVGVGRVLREELAVLVHELVELLGRVLATTVCGEQRVEILEHVANLLHRLGISAGQRLLHPGELRVEHFLAQQLLDLLVLCPRVRRAPVVVRELTDRPGRLVRQ